MDNDRIVPFESEVSYATGIENSHRLESRDCRQTPRQKPGASANLIGRGGVAFIEFQLARRGFESIRTLDSSASGDLWAETGIGRISIEVKSTDSGRSWFVRKSQYRSEIFAFVNLSGGYCYILTAQEVEALLARFSNQSTPTYKIPENWMRKTDLEAWSKLGMSYFGRLPQATDIDVPLDNLARRRSRRIVKVRQ